MKRTTTTFALLITLISAAAISADSIDPGTLEPAEAGLAIARERDDRDLGFHDFRAQLRMVLKNRHGETSERSLRSATLEQETDGDKSLVVFDAPANNHQHDKDTQIPQRLVEEEGMKTGGLQRIACQVGKWGDAMLGVNWNTPREWGGRAV